MAPAYIFENQPLISNLLNLPPYSVLASAVGQQWYPGTTPTVVKYPGHRRTPQRAFPTHRRQVIGHRAQVLNTDILNAIAANPDGKVVVAGESLGSMVIDREQAYLVAHPEDAPSPDQLSFLEFANPERGIADTYLPAGVHVAVPRIYRAKPDVGEPVRHDDRLPPVRGLLRPSRPPWNLLADANAMAGVNHYHLYTEFVSQNDVVEVGTPVTNSAGGTTTTYMIPASYLPLLTPLVKIGMPAPMFNALNTG